MLHYARAIFRTTALSLPRVRALPVWAPGSVLRRRRPPHAILKGSICGPSFRLLTALEEPHPPAGTAYLCRENFRVVREHKLLENHNLSAERPPLA